MGLPSNGATAMRRSAARGCYCPRTFNPLLAEKATAASKRDPFPPSFSQYFCSRSGAFCSGVIDPAAPRSREPASHPARYRGRCGGGSCCYSRTRCRLRRQASATRPLPPSVLPAELRHRSCGAAEARRAGRLSPLFSDSGARASRGGGRGEGGGGGRLGCWLPKRPTEHLE